MTTHNPFETGFDMANYYVAPRSYLRELSDEQRQDICVDNHLLHIHGSDALTDAAWDMANYGDETALTVLGIAAHGDVPSKWEYEAIPGYLEPPALPKSSRQQARTVFDFEREMLDLEEQRFNVFVKLPAASALRVAKRAEKTPFDIA